MVHLWDDSNEAHNDYLRFALELGVLGLGVYGLFLLSLLLRAAEEYRRSEERALLSLHLVAWILAFAAMSLADNMLHHTPVMWLTAIWWGAMFGVLAQEKYDGGWNFLK